MPFLASPVLADLAFNLLAARWQMAFTLGAHIILATFGVAMPLLLLAAEWRYLRTGDPLWRTLAQRWSHVFAVLFAVGAISGTVLSFELGLLWPEFMRRFGSVIAFPFAMEGFAFFLEAIFVGIYLYGWDRLRPWTHWWCGVPIAVSGAASGWFVVTVNAWMNVPRGFRLQDGRVVDVDPYAALLNPATGPQTAHMLLAAYLATGFVVAGVYAWYLLADRQCAYCRRGLGLGLIAAVIATPAQWVVGDWSARVVARTQPVKLAALEGQFRTEPYAPLRIGGLPDPAARATRYALEIPGLLSWLAYKDRAAVVTGLDDFPVDETPPVVVVHLAFQTMVGIATLLLALSVCAAAVFVRRRTLPESRWFLWSLVAAGPLSLVALIAGWVVTEVGRQPWIVHQVARTADAVTQAPYVGWLLAVTVVLYGTIGLGTLAALGHLARRPLTEDSSGT